MRVRTGSSAIPSRIICGHSRSVRVAKCLWVTTLRRSASCIRIVHRNSDRRRSCGAAEVPPERFDEAGRNLRRQCCDGIVLCSPAEGSSGLTAVAHPAGATSGGRDLDRADLPPPSPATTLGKADAGENLRPSEQPHPRPDEPCQPLPGRSQEAESTLSLGGEVVNLQPLTGEAQ